MESKHSFTNCLIVALFPPVILMCLTLLCLMNLDQRLKWGFLVPLWALSEFGAADVD